MFANAGVSCRVIETTQRGDAHAIARQFAARLAIKLARSAPSSNNLPLAHINPPLPYLSASIPLVSLSRPRILRNPLGIFPQGYKDIPGVYKWAAPAEGSPSIDCGEPDVDGIISVGGDGVFNEVLNGLMEVADMGTVAAARVRLGLIPAGSTDAVVCSIHGTRDPRTAAAHIVLGAPLSAALPWPQPLPLSRAAPEFALPPPRSAPPCSALLIRSALSPGHTPLFLHLCQQAGPSPWT